MARDRASRPEARPLRLFVAVEVPEEARELVAAAVAPWRESFPRGKWVPTQNQHVTLKFLGSTWPRLVRWVIETVGAVAAGAEPFESRVAGLGAFPSARRARVLWAGLEDPGGRMGALSAALEDALSAELEPEKRAFTAHLTVARFEPPVELGEELGRSELRSKPFTVERLVLFRSHLQRPAPRYEPLGTFPLGG
ncbi:MAG: RNA 2',3'-cyclic phosphodiesterase [Actinobacteria bacterium]|nr:RNA 2',3'-cyclic phosphodiesterase [Actinomycetota bacterium]